MFFIECTNNHTIEVARYMLETYDVKITETRHKKYLLLTVEDNGNSNAYGLCEFPFSGESWP